MYLEVNFGSKPDLKNPLPRLFKTVCNKLFKFIVKKQLFKKIVLLGMPISKRWEETKTFQHEYISLNLVFSGKTFQNFNKFQEFLADLFI